MPAKPLNETQLAEAARLKAIFIAWQKMRKDAGEKADQLKVSELFGFGQSALSQYINGGIPLNIEASVKFSRVLGVGIAEFSPTIVARIKDAVAAIGAPDVASGAGPQWIDPTAYQLLELYSRANIEDKAEIMNTAIDANRRRDISGTASNKI